MDLNVKQRRILIFAAILIALQVIFPPWATYAHAGKRSNGYGFIFSGSGATQGAVADGVFFNPKVTFESVDLERLVFQVVITGILAGILALATRKGEGATLP